MDTESNPEHKQSLPVLPHSGKVDQLKQEMTTTPPTPSSDFEGPMHESTPNLSIEQKLIEGKVVAAVRNIYDPEIPLNIYDLGLIYKIELDPENRVKVQMTLTAPGCPVAGSLPAEVERKIEAVEEVKSAEVELVWDPPWSKDRMSEAARLTLGLF